MPRIIRTEQRRTNLVFATANAAFEAANNALTTTTDIVARDTANAAFDYANTITQDNTIANLAYDLANSSNYYASLIDANTKAAFDSANALLVIPVNTQATDYFLTVSDSGKIINVAPNLDGTLNITLPNTVYSAGEKIKVYNDGLGIVYIKPDESVVLHTANTIMVGGEANSITGTTPTEQGRNVASRGLATILCVHANTFVIYGPGVNSALGAAS